MRFINLASSSSGNCHYIELDRKDLPPVKLMLEVGLSYSDILSKCITNQIDFNSIDAFLVTHGHGDHSRAVMDLIKRHKRVFANHELTLANPLTTLESAKTSFIAVDTKVIPFDVEHDAPHSLGFVITTGLETILFVNDCKYFNADLSHIKFDFIFIESNYDGVKIHYAYEQAKDLNDKGNILRYERLINAHMSNSTCVKHLKKMDLSNCKGIFLMHLSDRHANEYQFKKNVMDATGVKCYCCKKNGGFI